MTTSPSPPAALSDVLRLKRLLDRVGLNSTLFLLPVVLALAVAALEGVIIALLVPLAQGVMTMDFAFARGLPVLGSLLAGFFPGLANSNAAVFACLVVLIFLISVAKNIMQYGSMVTVCHLVRRFSNNARKTLFSRCLGFGKLYFDRTNAGYLQDVLVNSTSYVAFRLTDLQQFFAWLFQLLTYLIMMFVLSWKLTSFVLLVFPLLHYTFQELIRRINANSLSYSDAQAEMSRRLFNVLSCMPVVRSYATEEVERRDFSDISDRVAGLEFSIDKKLTLVQPLQEVIVLGLILVLISVMATIAAKAGRGTIPAFLVYFYVIRRAAVAFGAVNNMMATLAAIGGPMGRLESLLDDADKHFVLDGSLRFRGLERGVELRGLSHAFDGRAVVLDAVSFTIEKGEMTAIVGPSGAGKTTIINLLSRFYDCSPGTILLDGKDIRQFTLESLRTSMALVSQDTLLFNDTLRANICYGLNGAVDDAKLRQAVRKARLDDLVSRLPKGLETSIGDRGVQLSGGEKQRVSIARALLKGSDILIFDEATSALDSKTEKLIQEAVDELVKDKTAIVIAHRLSTLKKVDKVVVIDNGRLVETGRLDELLQAKGRFHQYWKEQRFF